MKTIGFFSQKGGSGKTTLSIHSAVAAYDDGMPVALIDADPQESASGWSQVRDRPGPYSVKANPSNVATVLELARREGCELCVLDCPPHAQMAASQLVAYCDYVIIPCQPTPLDCAAAWRAVGVVRAARKPFAFVINRAPARAPEVEEVRHALAAQGPVYGPTIGERRSFARALTGGLAVTEFDGRGKAAAEILAVWAEIRRALA